MSQGVFQPIGKHDPACMQALSELRSYCQSANSRAGVPCPKDLKLTAVQHHLRGTRASQPAGQ